MILFALLTNLGYKNHTLLVMWLLLLDKWRSNQAAHLLHLHTNLGQAYSTKTRRGATCQTIRL